MIRNWWQHPNDRGRNWPADHGELLGPILWKDSKTEEVQDKIINDSINFVDFQKNHSL